MKFTRIIYTAIKRTRSSMKIETLDDLIYSKLNPVCKGMKTLQKDLFNFNLVVPSLVAAATENRDDFKDLQKIPYQIN